MFTLPDTSALSSLTLLRPIALLLIPVALALPLVRALWRRRRYVSLPTTHLLPARAWRPSALRRLPIAFALAAVASIAVALAEPVIPHTRSTIESLGIDIVLVMDLSSSMSTEMGGTSPPGAPPAPTRLDVTRQALKTFVSARHGDRLGMVVFSNYAYVVSPLTVDKEYVLRYLDIVDNQILRNEAMTAIGDGIDMATFLLERQNRDTRRTKVIVVFTDGERNYGRDPLESIADASARDIRVHLVGLDLDEQLKEREGVQALIAAVRRQGGRYYEADTVRELRAASAALDGLEKSLVTTRAHVTNQPVYHWFALLAVTLICSALLLNALPFFSERT